MYKLITPKQITRLLWGSWMEIDKNDPKEETGRSEKLFHAFMDSLLRAKTIRESEAKRELWEVIWDGGIVDDDWVDIWNLLCDKYEQKTDKDVLMKHEDPYVKNKEELTNSRKKVLEIADYIIPGHGKMFKFEK